MNSLYQQLQGQQPVQNTMSSPSSNFGNAISNLAQQYQNGQITEQQAMNQILRLNPQMSQIFNMMQGRGMSYKQLFYQLAQMKGVDPSNILRQFGVK